MTGSRKASLPQSAGQLLEQVVDLQTDMGITYERSVGFHRDFHAHARDMLLFPRRACRVQVGLRKAGSSQQINGNQVLFVPRGVEHDLRALSAVYEVIAIFPSATYMRQLLSENDLDARDGAQLQASCLKLKRSRWLDDLIERYVFERLHNEQSPAGCVFFLEKQMLNEMARLIFTDKLKTHGDVLGDKSHNANGASGHEDGMSLALRYIEAHLFEDLDLEQVGAAAKLAPSTLLRTFKKALGTTPGAYIKERRLDEAALLIDRGSFRIGDICMLVGYGDLSAFTRSFRSRFGVSPTAYRARSEQGLFKRKGGN